MFGAKLKILISRTDSIGDVVLTMPIMNILKENIRISELHFLGKSYTEDVVLTSSVVDKFLDYDMIEKLSYVDQIKYIKTENYDAIIHVLPNLKIAKLAKDAEIPMRIGTTNRWFHWITCNRLVKLSRRMSDLHEAQLNLKLLEAFEINKPFLLRDIFPQFKLNKVLPLPDRLQSFLHKEKINLILHPKSNKSAREWGLENFFNLINLLSPFKYQIFISGTNTDGVLMREWLKCLPDHVVDLTGSMTLKEFISFIYHADGLVAASTGPLHLAASLGNNALGLYAPVRPIFPQRWAPIGPNASYLVAETACDKCLTDESKCECMEKITPDEVVSVISKWQKRPCSKI